MVIDFITKLPRLFCLLALHWVAVLLFSWVVFFFVIQKLVIFEITGRRGSKKVLHILRAAFHGKQRKLVNKTRRVSFCISYTTCCHNESSHVYIYA